MSQFPCELMLDRVCGGLRLDEEPVPIESATWYVSSAKGDGLERVFQPGLLAEAE